MIEVSEGDVHMYKVYRGDSCDFYKRHRDEVKGKAKLVYLDPPYNSKRNRGARKYYNDSNMLWSLFISNIINYSYEMLRDDGFLAISINQTELFNLKGIVDEYFGEENFIGLFPVKIRHKERQLMINATFHDVYEYLLIYRKNKQQRFICENKPANLEKFCYKITILDRNCRKEEINGKQVEIYDAGMYKITKVEPSEDNLRRYIIAGKLKTANWSGEWFENNLRALGNDKLVKVYGLENEGLGYRWFQTQNDKRVSGVYFQSTLCAGRPILPTNDLDYTEIVPNIYKEGGEGCDFKDSKKPEKLLEWIISITTNKGDLVIDLFGGSGTTIDVCIKNSRDCIIVEKHLEPYNIIKRRIENAIKDCNKNIAIEYMNV